MQNGGKVDRRTDGTAIAPSLIRRLMRRSGVMTFEDASDSAVDEALTNPRFARVAQLVERYASGGKVLDIGCWTGSLARVLTNRVSCSYTGIDIEPAARAVETARKAMPDQSFVVVPSVESLPFAAGAFDAVVLTEVIEHVPAGREGPLLMELTRVLRPGGSIILSTPYNNVLTPLDPAWFFGHRHYSVSRLAELAREAGLVMQGVEFTGGIATALDTNLLYFYKHILHRHYKTYPWLGTWAKREYAASPRGILATTVWCRFVRAS